MSLVGPRPEVEEFVARYDKRQLEVLKVRPGITDQASVEFANESDYLSRFTDAEAAYTKEVLPKKLQLNLEYIQNQSFWSDITIILRTLFRFTGEEKKH
jgi:lipopolysaccharide/colanic/teichoic acid biosynthesis glycosyltransferase